MSEPEKQPEKVEPADIKPITDAAQPEKTEKPVPAAANTNEKTVERPVEEPAANVTPIDVTPKKDPVVTVPVPPVADEVPAAPVNDNATKTETPVVAPVATENTTVKPATTDVAAEAVIPNPAQEAPTPAQDIAAAAAAPAPGKKGWAKKAFNFAVKMGVGAAVSAALKTTAIVGAGIAGAPAWATILVAGLAVGVGATLVHNHYERKAQKAEGKELSKYFSAAHGKELVSKKSLKTFGISTVAAVAGSMLFIGLSEGIIQGWWNSLTGAAAPDVTPPVVVAPVVAPVVVPEPVAPPVEVAVAPPVEAAPVVAPVVVPCVTPVEQFNTLIDGHQVSAQVTDAMHRAASTNAKVAAQGVKDLAFYAHNGFGGVPKNPNVAVELFKQAADAGNVQAKVDLLYMQHHGLDGIPQNKGAALAAMQDIKGSARAAMFTKSWGGSAQALPSVKFDTGTILQGMKVGCAV
jgi:hypothetical protein